MAKRTTTARPGPGPRSASPSRGRQRAAAAPARGGARATTGRSRSTTSARPVKEPDRPTDATFRRRRLVVLTLVLLVAVGLVFGVRAAVGAIIGDDAPAAYVSPTATGGVDGTDAATEVTTAPTPPSESQLANPVACDPDAVRLAVELPASTLGKGKKSHLPATITNTGAVPCLLDVGASQLVATIYSGDDLVWSSTDCAGDGTRRILLDVNASDVTTITWPGTRSSEGCPSDPKTAKPGTYRVVVTLLTAVAEDSEAEPATIAEVEETFKVA